MAGGRLVCTPQIATWGKKVTTSTHARDAVCSIQVKEWKVKSIRLLHAFQAKSYILCSQSAWLLTVCMCGEPFLSLIHTCIQLPLHDDNKDDHKIFKHFPKRNWILNWQHSNRFWLRAPYEYMIRFGWWNIVSDFIHLNSVYEMLLHLHGAFCLPCIFQHTKFVNYITMV